MTDATDDDRIIRWTRQLAIWTFCLTMVTFGLLILGYFNWQVNEKLLNIQEFIYKPRVYPLSPICTNGWNAGESIISNDRVLVKINLMNVGGSEGICTVNISTENIPLDSNSNVGTITPYGVIQVPTNFDFQSQRFIDVYGPKNLPEEAYYEIFYSCKSVTDLEFPPSVRVIKCKYTFNSTTDRYELIPNNF